MKSKLFHTICRYNKKSLLELFFNYIKDCSRLENKLKSLLDEPDEMGHTPLLISVSYDAYDCVEWLLKSQIHPIKITARTHDGDNILHICAKRMPADKSTFQCVWKGLDESNKVDLLQQMNVENDTPWFAAIRANNEEVFGILLEYLYKSNLQSTDYLVNIFSKTTAYHEACKIGNIGMLKSINTYYYLRKASLTQDITGYTCLHWAVVKNHLEIAKYLIDELHVDVDTIGDRRRTSLHVACEYGSIEMIKFLIEQGASTTLRDTKCYNCLEIAIVQQHEEAVKILLEHDSWRDMMRNAQPLNRTEAFDTPMRKLIRYLPKVAICLIDEKLTTRIGGPGQKVHQTIYDYEFYEDMTEVKDWYSKDTVINYVSEEPRTCCNVYQKRGIHGVTEYICSCCCCFYCRQCCCQPKNKALSTKRSGNVNSQLKHYTNDAQILVRNHPLFLCKEQTSCPELAQHPFNVLLRITKFRGFDSYLFLLSFFTYLTYLGLLTTLILKGKPPDYFYDQANITMTVDLRTCEQVTRYFLNNVNRADPGFASDEYKRIRLVLFVVMSTFIAKNIIVILALFPKVLITFSTYLEIAAVVLSYVYVLNWYSWQDNIILRCPVQYQLGATGLLLSYINLLTYIRTAPVFDLGVYVLMLQLITAKFFRFLPVLLIIICGFAFTFWMLLQNQTVYGTPIEAIMRTSLMLFDLGYEDRLYNSDEGGIGYYKLVHVVFMLTAIVLSIFVINLLIGLAVGEIPSLMTQGTIWRTHLLYDLTSDYEIMRIQFNRFINSLRCCSCCQPGLSHYMPPIYMKLQMDERKGVMGMERGPIYRFEQFLNGGLYEVIDPKKT